MSATNTGRAELRKNECCGCYNEILNGQNQFASGGLLLMIIGGVGVFLRQLPLRCWSWIVEQTTMTITVKDDDVAFHWVKEWFLEQEFLKRVRRVDLDTTLRGQGLAMIPAPGRHWFMYRSRPFWIWFYRSDNTKERTQRRMESLTFQHDWTGPPVPEGFRRRGGRVPSAQAADRFIPVRL